MNPFRVTANQREPFDRFEKMIFIVVLLVSLSLGGIGYGTWENHVTQRQGHEQTLAEIKAANCVTASCESPAIKAIIQQAAVQLAVIEVKDDQPDHQLICASLDELNTAQPQQSATETLKKYC